VLAANVAGWGAPALFEAYEIERRRVAARVRIGSARHAAVRFQSAGQYDPMLHEDSEAGVAKRLEVGAFIKDAGNLENEAWGLEWGYRYDDSPIVCHERGEAPDYEWERDVPGTWPGARAPNVFLPDGRPIFDTLANDTPANRLGRTGTDRLPEPRAPRSSRASGHARPVAPRPDAPSAHTESLRPCSTRFVRCPTARQGELPDTPRVLWGPDPGAVWLP